MLDSIFYVTPSKVYLFKFIACFFWSLATYVSAKEKFTFARPFMGTEFAVTGYSDCAEKARAASDSAFKLVGEINAVASDYTPRSELSKLSNCGVNVEIPLSDILYDLLSRARYFAQITDGAFDPSLAPITHLWREARITGALPSAEVLLLAKARCGWQNFRLNDERKTITLLREGMGFDLGGIAKGYAADRMLEAFYRAGMRQILIRAGGDIRLGDPPPGREGWNVAIKTFDLDHPTQQRLLANAAVSTSGDLHQYIEIAGVKYSHIVDPATGLGLVKRIAVVVVAKDSTTSDVLATAASVMGNRKVHQLVKFRGFTEMDIWTRKDDGTSEVQHVLPWE